MRYRACGNENREGAKFCPGCGAPFQLNRNEPATGHYMIQLDCTVTIPMRGGTTVTVGMYDHNGEAIANGEKYVLDAIPPAPDPFPGTSPRWNVVSVGAQR
jgi:hypothetical protein